MASKTNGSLTSRVLARDSSGMVWQVYPSDCEPTPDGKLQAKTPRGEVIYLPPESEWNHSTIYNGAAKDQDAKP